MLRQKFSVSFQLWVEIKKYLSEDQTSESPWKWVILVDMNIFLVNNKQQQQQLSTTSSSSTQLQATVVWLLPPRVLKYPCFTIPSSCCQYQVEEWAQVVDLWPVSAPVSPVWQLLHHSQPYHQECLQLRTRSTDLRTRQRSSHPSLYLLNWETLKHTAIQIFWYAATVGSCSMI